MLGTWEVLVDTNQMLIAFPWANRQREGQVGEERPSSHVQKAPSAKTLAPGISLSIVSVLCLKPGTEGLGGIHERSFRSWNVARLPEQSLGSKHTPSSQGTLEDKTVHWGKHQENPSFMKVPCLLLISPTLPQQTLTSNCCPICCLKVLRKIFVTMSYRSSLFLLTS